MTTESDTDWRERALRAEAELQRLSFVAGNIGIEHPEWPPEYGRHLAALSSSLASVTAQRDAAVEALRKADEAMMTWAAVHAPGPSGEQAVRDAKRRILEASGTLGYIADVNAAVRGALKEMAVDGQ